MTLLSSGCPGGPVRLPALVAAAVAAALVPAFLAAPGLEAQSLRGSRSAMERQVRSARSHDYTFLQTATEVRRFVDDGWLVVVSGSRDYELSGVSFPYARPEVLLFIERLGRQYRAACGEKLVVTSLTRPRSHQPSNASTRSVHPTGMALDLRRSRLRSCRRWLEGVLISLERRGVLDATYEARPPHYHVALFPNQYAAYVERLRAGSGAVAKAPPRAYTVAPGDTLWQIAREHKTTVPALQRENALASSHLRPGQQLRIPE
jgi:hypothetical protein